jgi:hypothetical protein
MWLVGLARLIAKLALPRQVRRDLAKVFDPIDQRVPMLLASGAQPETVRSEVAWALAERLSDSIKPGYIEAAMLLYDPLMAALKSKR